MLDWIAARPEFDKGRVVFSGASYGGWLALQAGAVYNNEFAASSRARQLPGTSSPTWSSQDPGRLDDGRREFGDERNPQMPEYLLSISPVSNAAKLKTPTLLQHPGLDTRVGLGQANCSHGLEGEQRNGLVSEFHERQSRQFSRRAFRTTTSASHPGCGS